MVFPLLKLGHLREFLLREHLELRRLLESLGGQLAALLKVGHLFLLLQDKQAHDAHDNLSRVFLNPLLLFDLLLSKSLLVSLACFT